MLSNSESPTFYYDHPETLREKCENVLVKGDMTYKKQKHFIRHSGSVSMETGRYGLSKTLGGCAPSQSANAHHRDATTKP